MIPIELLIGIVLNNLFFIAADFFCRNFFTVFQTDPFFLKFIFIRFCIIQNFMLPL